MADMFLGSAQGAIDSLLGWLTSALADEASLLSGIRADVHFIKDEMDSMNGFLLHVAEATGGSGEEDHGVRAWMKQVAEVAYASQNYVDLYARCNGMGTTTGVDKAAAACSSSCAGCHGCCGRCPPATASQCRSGSSRSGRARWGTGGSGTASKHL
jgi:hypothetical protein